MLPATRPEGGTGTHKAQAIALADIISRLTGDLVVTLDDQGQVLAVHPGGAGQVPAAGACGAPGAWAQSCGQDWAQAWVGRSWVDTVAPECRQKARRMLLELTTRGCARRREISHPAHDGHPVLRAWTALRLAEDGLSLALGHDPAPQRLQVERLKSVQDQLEQSYWENRRERDESGA